MLNKGFFVALTAMLFTVATTQSLQAAKVVGNTAAEFNVASGAASYSIPIYTAPGRGGMQPKLSLEYNSNSGNGVVGVGWSIGGLSAIHRCPKTIAQDGEFGGINFDADDRYCMNGQRLIPINGVDGGVGAEYNTQIDNYSQIKSYGGSANNPSYWVVKTKAGQVITYGGDSDSSPSLNQGRASWSIKTLNDTTGNNPISFSYNIEENSQYLSEVSYTGGRVNFDYSNSRHDPRQSFIKGNEINLNRRLRSVRSYHESTLVRTYNLLYGGSSLVSLLTSVKECDADSQCFHWTKFEWEVVPSASEGGKMSARGWITGAYGNWDSSSGGSRTNIADMDGDGINDVLIGPDSSGRWSVMLNTGNALVDQGTWISGAYGNWDDNSGPSRTRVVDLTGDGLSDVLLGPDSGGRWYVMRNTGSSLVNEGAWISGVAGSYDTSSGASRINIADMNGDGLNDVLIGPDSSGRWSVMLNTGSSFEDSGLWISGAYGSYDTSSGGSRTNVVDMNGDGLNDVLIGPDSSGRWSVMRNTGSSFVDEGPWISGAYSGYDTSSGGSRTNVVDMNGDGLRDVLVGPDGSGRWSVMLNTGSALVDQGTWISGAYGNWDDNSGPSRTHAVDMNGDGLTDVLLGPDSNGRWYVMRNTGSALVDEGYWISDVAGSYDNASGASRIKVVDMTGDGINDVLVGPDSGGNWTVLYNRHDQQHIRAIKDSYGNETSVDYLPLSNRHVYTKHTNADTPVVRDITGPQHVVRRVKTNNGMGDDWGDYNTVEYTYEGLKAHTQGRGSYGYAKITEHYPETNKTKEMIGDQAGFPFDVNKSKQIIVEYYDGQKINEIETVSHRTIDGNVYTVNVESSVEKSYELGNTTPVTTVHTSYDQEKIDSYGNIGEIKVETTANGETFTKTTISNYETSDLANWVLGRLENSVVTHTSPDSPDEYRKSAYTYYPGTGLLKTEKIIGLDAGGNPTGRELATTTYEYDIYGQKTDVSVSAPGEITRTSSTKYDLYGKPEESCNVYDQCETYTYYPEGWLHTTTGPNDITTTWEYDGFGRQTKETRQDNTETTISRHLFSYYSGVCGTWVRYGETCTVSQSTGSEPVIVQYDAFGREVRKITRSFDDRDVYSDTEYNGLGQVVRVSRPYYAGNHIYWATSEYDALDRVVRATEPGPHGSVNEITTVYDGLSTTVTSGRDLRVKTTTINAIGQTVHIEEEENTYTNFTYYADGNLRTTVVAGDIDTTVTLEYDEFGRKGKMIDPAMGTWSYSYDAFSQLKSQTDAKNQTSTMTYDLLGRVITRTEPEGSSQWEYWGNPAATNGDCGMGSSSVPAGSLGKLRAECNSAITKSYAYDSLGRATSSTTSIAGAGSFTTQTSYDSIGRVNRVTYPGTQGFFTENVYNDVGYLEQVRGLRSQAEEHDLAKLVPLISQATALAEEYHNKAEQLRSFGETYERSARNYSDNSGSVNISNSLPNTLNGHATLLSDDVSTGTATTTQTTDTVALDTKFVPIMLDGIMIPIYVQQMSSAQTTTMAMSPEFLGHLNNTIIELENVSALLNQASVSYEDAAEQLTVLAEQTLAAADHSFQIERTLDNAAVAYGEMSADTNYISYWRALDVDASGRVSAEVYGNGIVNDYAYNQGTGQLQSIHSSFLVSIPIRHLEYQYDAYNNVSLRDDLVNDISESFDYDRLDRLNRTDVSSGLYTSAEFNGAQTLDYDALGNITYKSDVGHYNYSGNGPNAVSQAGNKSYSYDANGNMVSGDGRNIDWNSFNKPTRILKGSKWAEFSYGPTRSRYQKVNHKGDTTLYVGGLYERLTKGSVVEQKHYIYAAGQLVAEHIVSTKDGTQSRYLHKDALGSVDLITDSHGNVVDRRSFDAWGKLRNLTWKDQEGLNDLLYITQLPFTNKGYTGHENIQEVDLIHMNGRLYDATLARFISADPHIQAASLSQNYNRYSYVMNNPMKYTDPSGYFFNKLFRKIRTEAVRAWRDIRPYIGVIVGVIVGIFCQVCGAGIINAALTGAALGAFSAGMAGGNILQGALIGAFTAGAAKYIGGSTAFGEIGKSGIDVTRSLAHGVVGGVANVMRGGKFGTGFMSAAFTKAVSNPIQGVSEGIAGSDGPVAHIAGATSAALVGGTASVIGGGKFANGAQTASLQYLFNQVAKTPAERAKAKLTNQPLSGSKLTKANSAVGQGCGAYQCRTGGKHAGVDILSADGTKLQAPGSGTASVGFLKGYGKTVLINHGGGVQTRFAHLASYLVNEGATVTVTTDIGTVGTTGNVPSGGQSHLHFEVLVDGNRINPSDVFTWAQDK